MKQKSVSKDKLICIRSFRSREEANLYKGILESYNIQSMVTADDAGGMYPFPLGRNPTGVGLYIKQKDKEKVQKLIT